MWEGQNYSMLMKEKVRQHRETSCTIWVIAAAKQVESSYSLNDPQPPFHFLFSWCCTTDQTNNSPPFQMTLRRTDNATFSIGELQGGEMPDTQLREAFSSWFYTQLFKFQH